MTKSDFKSDYMHLQDSSNFYSTLVGMKDDRGNRIFEVLEARAACALCLEKLDDPR